MEEVNLGILGKYSLEDVVCDSDFDSDGDKLPENFQNMTDEEKSSLFYEFEM